MGVQESLQNLLSILWGMYPDEAVLDRIVILCLILRETALLFSMVTIPFHNPTNSTQGFNFFGYSPTRAIFSLIVANLMGMKHCLVVVSMCLSVMISDAEHLSLGLLAIYISSLEKCIQVLCPFLNHVVYSFNVEF